MISRRGDLCIHAAMKPRGRLVVGVDANGFRPGDAAVGRPKVFQTRRCVFGVLHPDEQMQTACTGAYIQRDHASRPRFFFVTVKAGAARGQEDESRDSTESHELHQEEGWRR